MALLSIEGTVFNTGTLRSAYRDSVTKLPDSSVHRKIIDDSTIVEPCPICLQNGDIGVEMVMLRCECPHWGHESCMAKSVFETGSYTSLRIYAISAIQPLSRTLLFSSLEPSQILRLLQHTNDSGFILTEFFENDIPTNYAICPTCKTTRFSFDTVLLLSTACTNRDVTSGSAWPPGGDSLLVDHGASISQEDIYQQTAICWASKEGHKDTVKELLLTGGDISYMNSKGRHCCIWL